MVTVYEHVFQWENYLKLGKRMFIRRKEHIYTQGTNGDGFYFLHKGLVKIVTITATKKERVLNIVIPNQLLGVQSLDQKKHFTTAVAVKDSVVYHFPSEEFREFMLQDPELNQLFSKSVIHKMKILLDRINMNALTSEQRLALLLQNVCDEFKNYEIPLSQQDLSSCTGLTRITVYKVLKDWKMNEVIDSDNKIYYIKKPDFLRNLVKETF
ncbi:MULTISPECIES: Crp/Fnr family transcriptional regulator [unclassified Cytobacillus]|uniref:Crp/Fnr family transcriptional regulator n=1 Tax=unclassified Cytobacillus TaxID=2675268 RepID=UPI00203B5F3F|nr:Crp/Fnr family transcriptional regulator [Cytobacillus sp. AMY 15.2]MCM3091560.1 Crp/Fnr family transcriptional regulator [Cytobacillus sp. AMY 15.2]